jgi:hypothetical protein
MNAYECILDAIASDFEQDTKIFLLQSNGEWVRNSKNSVIIAEWTINKWLDAFKVIFKYVDECNHTITIKNRLYSSEKLAYDGVFPLLKDFEE